MFPKLFTSREGPLRAIRLSKTKNLIAKKNISFFTYSREALIELLEFNKISESDEIILPNYLCSTVIECIFAFTKKLKYYKVNESLSYNKEEVSGLISNKTRLIVFVDYFGVETTVEKDLELKLKDNNIILLKDASHSFLSLVNRNYKKDYEYDYLISSIYKSLPLEVGSIAIGKFGQTHNFINLHILIKRFFVKFIKNFISFFGFCKVINKNLQNINISDSPPINYFYGFNVIKLYQLLVFHINFTKVISEKQDLVIQFNSLFSDNVKCKPLFTREIMGQNILQAYPILCRDKTQRDLILNRLRKNCIDAYTWPTFHRTNFDEYLWGRILLLPLNIKVIQILKNV